MVGERLKMWNLYTITSAQSVTLKSIKTNEGKIAWMLHANHEVKWVAEQ